MEQDIISLLESKVDGLIARVESLERENQSLKEELETAKDRIAQLESQKQGALEKIRHILEKIDEMSTDTAVQPTPGSAVSNEPQEDHELTGGKALF